MNASPSVGDCHGALQLIPDGCNVVVSEFLPIAAGLGPNKRKRRAPGTPDPGAEVVALSPKALLESDKYICEICNQGFQRDQNLQMHKRRHKVPWKLLKRPNLGKHKRVFVCPEKSCLHHDPSHALGDLVGIKKHYRRKHCTEKQWKCDKCSKGYAVQSDYKAHLKTCGTRGHCCDCGRVFSRVESFIEHQDSCGAVKRKSSQSRVESERKLPHQYNATGRNSHESASQSTDTTHAISFAQSGTRDSAAISADSIKEYEHNLSQGIQGNQTEYSAVMPPWWTDQCNQLELHSPTQRLLESAFSQVEASGSTIAGFKRHVSHNSSSHITRCSSIYLADHEVCDPLTKPLPPPPCRVDVNTPSLALSIRPCGTNADLSTSSSSVDKKSGHNALEKEVLALTALHSQTSVGIRRIQSNSLCLATPGSDLALSIFPGILTQSQNRAAMDQVTPAMDTAVSLKDFLKQAVPRLSLFPAQSNQANLLQLKTLSEINSPLEMGANRNSAVGALSNLDNRARKIHDSGRRSSHCQAPVYDLLLSRGSI